MYTSQGRPRCDPTCRRRSDSYVLTRSRSDYNYTSWLLYIYSVTALFMPCYLRVLYKYEQYLSNKETLVNNFFPNMSISQSLLPSRTNYCLILSPEPRQAGPNTNGTTKRWEAERTDNEATLAWSSSTATPRLSALNVITLALSVIHSGILVRPTLKILSHRNSSSTTPLLETVENNFTHAIPTWRG